MSQLAGEILRLVLLAFGAKGAVENFFAKSRNMSYTTLDGLGDCMAYTPYNVLESATEI